MMIPGPAGTHEGKVHILVMSVSRAAGNPPIFVVIEHGGMMASGNAGWGTGVGTGAGGWIGAWQCGAGCNTLSVILAAGGMVRFLILGEIPSFRYFANNLQYTCSHRQDYAAGSSGGSSRIRGLFLFAGRVGNGGNALSVPPAKAATSGQGADEFWPWSSRR